MNTFAQICIALSALTLLAVFPLEAFLIDRHKVQKFLGIESAGIRNVHLWSFCIGARNALVGVGALVGLVMLHLGDASTGRVVVIVCAIYMVLSSLFMGVADLLGYWLPRGGSVKGVLGSSVLPAAALVSLAVAG